MKIPSVTIQPVGTDSNNPTRFDIVAVGVAGAFCGYTKDLIEAESWKDGIERAIKHAYQIGYQHGVNKS